MQRILILTSFLITVALSLSGQSGGEGVYPFLQLTTGARTAALGGTQIALTGSEPELTFQNPALLSTEMNNTLSLCYVRYVADIGYGYAVYAQDFGKLGTFAAGIHYINYGDFTGADENGEKTGIFSAADYALTLLYSKKINKFLTVGINLKPIYSHLENYQSFGFATDFGLHYQNTDRLTNMALAVRNLGGEITAYYPGGSLEQTKWTLQVGLSRQLKHAPIQIYITGYDLNRWNKFKSGDSEIADSENFQWSRNLAEEVLRHLAWGVEVSPVRKIVIRAGYNYQKRKELSVKDYAGLTGFSAGLGIQISSLHINYAIASYQRTGAVHFLSVSSNLSKLLHY